MSRFRVPAVLAAVAAALIAAGQRQQPAHAAASPCDIQGVERIVAVGDVHGAYDQFVQILRAAGVIDDRLKWSGGKTHLVQTGDVVDRGPDSRKVLDLLRRLEGEASAAVGAVHLLLGNHEVMRTLGDLRFVAPGEYSAFVTPQSENTRLNLVRQSPGEARAELLKTTPLGYVELRLAFGRDGEYGKQLKSRDTLVKINGIVFVHGGLSPSVAATACDAINSTVRRELTSDVDKTRAAPLESLAAREDGPMWYRGLATLTEPEIDGILASARASAIVGAHNVVAGGRIESRFHGKVFQIDTGMQPAYVQGGRPSALEIKGGVVTAIYVDSREVLEGAPR